MMHTILILLCFFLVNFVLARNMKNAQSAESLRAKIAENVETEGIFDCTCCCQDAQGNKHSVQGTICISEICDVRCAAVQMIHVPGCWIILRHADDVLRFNCFRFQKRILDFKQQLQLVRLNLKQTFPACSKLRCSLLYQRLKLPHRNTLEKFD